MNSIDTKLDNMLELNTQVKAPRSRSFEPVFKKHLLDMDVVATSESHGSDSTFRLMPDGPCRVLGPLRENDPLLAPVF